MFSKINNINGIVQCLGNYIIRNCTFTNKYAKTYLMLIANSPPSFCRTRKVPSDRDINRFLAAVLSMLPANLQAQ